MNLIQAATTTDNAINVISSNQSILIARSLRLVGPFFMQFSVICGSP
jgi:hypothetical protein